MKPRFQKFIIQMVQKSIFFLLKTFTLPWTYVISDLHIEKCFRIYWKKKKELQKTNQIVFSVVKVIKEKGGKLDIKFKGYGDLFKNGVGRELYDIN